MLTPTEADELLHTLRGVVRGGGAAARDRWCRWLEEHSPKDVLRLDERARATSWSAGPLGTSPEWEKVDLNRKDGLSAAIASLHPDGRLRERAVRVMHKHGRGLSRVFLAMRVVDHVPQIRGISLAALLDHADIRDAQVCLPVLHTVSRRNHGLYALNAYRQRLMDRHGVSAAIQLMDNPDLATRRAAYAMCLEQDALALDAWWARLERETDQVSKRLLAEHLIEVAHPSEVRNRLLTGPYVDGRLQAMYLLPDRDLSPEDIKKRLMDRSARVREAAQWRARRAGFGPGAFYLEAWRHHGASGSTVYVLLEGLRQTGQSIDVSWLRECLTSEKPRVRVAALKLWPADQPDKELLLRLLNDTSPRVVRAAAASLSHVGAAVAYDDLADAGSSPQPWTRLAAWRVRRDLGPWERLMSDLELQTGPEPDLQMLATNDLQAWLLHQAPTAYTAPTEGQRSTIQAALKDSPLDSALLLQLAFHAGVAAPAHTARSTGRTVGTPRLSLLSWLSRAFRRVC